MKEALETAKQVLTRFQLSGPIASAVPTPERLLQANGLVRVEPAAVRTVTVSRGGKNEVVGVKSPRIRFDGPFEHMVKRGQLAPGDAAKNRALEAAAHLYHAIWTQAGLEPLQGQNLARTPSTTSAGRMLASEARCDAFERYRSASDAMRRDERRVVDAVVLHDTALEDIGREITSHKDRKIVIGVATYVLRVGLERLAIHFGLLVDEDVTRAPGCGPPDRPSLHN